MKVVVVVDVKGNDVPIKALAEAIEAVVGVAIPGKAKAEVFTNGVSPKPVMRRRKPPRASNKKVTKAKTKRAYTKSKKKKTTTAKAA